MQSATERRHSRRVATKRVVIVRRIGGHSFNVELKDISTGGCRVEMAGPARVGDGMITRLPRLEPLGSCVKWAKGTTTGVEFRIKIHPAVFDQLVTRLPAAELKD